MTQHVHAASRIDTTLSPETGAELTNFSQCCIRYGRYVAFESAASNLGAGNSKGAWDIFHFDKGVKG